MSAVAMSAKLEFEALLRRWRHLLTPADLVLVLEHVNELASEVVEEQNVQIKSQAGV